MIEVSENNQDTLSNSSNYKNVSRVFLLNVIFNNKTKLTRSSFQHRHIFYYSN